MGILDLDASSKPLVNEEKALLVTPVPQRLTDSVSDCLSDEAIERLVKAFRPLLMDVAARIAGLTVLAFVLVSILLGAALAALRAL